MERPVVSHKCVSTYLLTNWLTDRKTVEHIFWRDELKRRRHKQMQNDLLSLQCKRWHVLQECDNKVQKSRRSSNRPLLLVINYPARESWIGKTHRGISSFSKGGNLPLSSSSLPVSRPPFVVRLCRGMGLEWKERIGLTSPSPIVFISCCWVRRQPWTTFTTHDMMMMLGVMSPPNRVPNTCSRCARHDNLLSVDR